MGAATLNLVRLPADKSKSPRSLTVMLSVVIPLLNERENIFPLYERVEPVMRELGLDFELIFVDDGSTDGSAERIAALRDRDSRVKLVSFSRNFGHQIALTAGMDAASGDAAVMMDADLQHPPEMIKELVIHWKAGYDIVYTLRASTADASAFKRLSSALFYRLFQRLTGVDMPANAADFRLVDRKVLDAFSEIRERGRFLRGLTSWVGFRSKGIPYEAQARTHGASKYDLRRMLGFAIEGILSFSTIPLTVGIYLGVAMAALSFLYTLFVLYAWLFSQQLVTGWTSMIILTSMIGGIQLILMGTIGLYIGKIYEEVKQRPLYLVRHRLGFDGEQAAGRPMAEAQEA